MTRTSARHGHGDLAERMGPVSGVVLEAAGKPTVYHAGDTVWYDGVRKTFDDVVVVNAGAAQFTEGCPITMTAEDVLATCEHTDATVIADHMDAINHCLLTREDLRTALVEAGVEEQVRVPEDGERRPRGRVTAAGSAATFGGVFPRRRDGSVWHERSSSGGRGSSAGTPWGSSSTPGTR